VKMVRCHHAKDMFRGDGARGLLEVFREKLLFVDSIALKIQGLRKIFIVHEEEKGEVQEHKVIPHDDRSYLEACVKNISKR